MSIVRLLPAWFHAIADYAVAALLILVPILAGGPRPGVAIGVTVGTVVAVLIVSLVTSHQYSPKRVTRAATPHPAGVRGRKITAATDRSA